MTLPNKLKRDEPIPATSPCGVKTDGTTCYSCSQVAEWDKTLRDTQSELFSLADDVQKLVLGQQVSERGVFPWRAFVGVRTVQCYYWGGYCQSCFEGSLASTRFLCVWFGLVRGRGAEAGAPSFCRGEFLTSGGGNGECWEADKFEASWTLDLSPFFRIWLECYMNFMNTVPALLPSLNTPGPGAQHEVYRGGTVAARQDLGPA